MKNPFMDLPDAAPRQGGPENPFMDLPDARPDARARPGGGAGRYLDDLVRQAANAASFGFADEASAWLGQATGLGPSADAPGYGAALTQERAQDRDFERDNPIAATAAQIAGAIAAPAPGIAWAARAPSLLGKMGRSAAVAAPLGALTGFGQGEDGIENRLDKARADGVLAAGIGAVLPPAVLGVGQAVEAGKTLLAPFTRKGREALAERQAVEGLTGAKITAGQFQPAAQQAIEAIDATAGAARRINEPLGRIDPESGAAPYRPTTGAAIGAPQALGFENKQRVASGAPFIARAAENNEALTALVNQLDSGDVGAARRIFATQGEAQAQAAEAALTQAEEALARNRRLAPNFLETVQRRGQQSIAQAEAKAKAALAELEAARSQALAHSGRAPEDISASVYSAIRDEILPPAIQKRDALYDAVPNERIGGSAGLRRMAEEIVNPFEAAPKPVAAIQNAPLRPFQPPRVLGPSPFGGDIYEGPKGADAISLLRMTQSGEVKAALFHPEIGDIDLPWGFYDKAADKGAGLAKIIGKHPEVLGDLDGIVKKMPISEASSGRIRLEDNQHLAVVALNHEGAEKQWLLTAFEKKERSAKVSEDGTQGSRYVPPKGYAPDRTVSRGQEGAPSGVDYSATNAIGQALGDFTAQELLQVRREANRVARAAAYSDPVKAHKAGQIAAEATRLLEGAGGRVAGAIRQADAYYAKDFAPNFRQGPGRDIATRGPQGEESRMAPSQALTAWIRPDGQKGAERAGQLKRIANGNATITGNVRDHFANLAAARAVKGETIDPGQIRQILSEYRAALDRFPEVRDGLERLSIRAQTAKGALEAALAAHKSARGTAKIETRRAEGIVRTELEKMQRAVDAARRSADKAGPDFDKSLPGIFASQDPEKAVAAILAKPDPAAAVRELMELAREAGPEALGGVKQAFTDSMKNRITQLSRASAPGGGPGEFKQSAAQLERLLGKNGAYRRAMEALYSPDEIRLLDSVRQEMSRTALLGQRATSGSDTAEKLPRIDTILSRFRQWMYGGSGVALASGNLGAAGLTGLAALAAWRAGKSREHIASIVQEAMLNPEIARAMLTRATKENAEKAIPLFNRIASKSPKLGLAAAAATD